MINIIVGDDRAQEIRMMQYPLSKRQETYVSRSQVASFALDWRSVHPAGEGELGTCDRGGDRGRGMTNRLRSCTTHISIFRGVAAAAVLAAEV